MVLTVDVYSKAFVAVDHEILLRKMELNFEI